MSVWTPGVGEGPEMSQVCGSQEGQAQDRVAFDEEVAEDGERDLLF